MGLLKSTEKVLFHASSIGPEVYAFAISCQMHGLNPRIYATDINPEFLDYSRQAKCPVEILGRMTPEEHAYFDLTSDSEVTPKDEIKKMVSFLPAMSFVNATSVEVFDTVFVANALTYVTEAEQAQAIDNIATYNSRYLIISAFHPDTIEADVTRNGYRPVLTNAALIHNAWSERIRTDFVPLRGIPEYSWVLPPFSEISGWQYKYCSIFEKSAK